MRNKSLLALLGMMMCTPLVWAENWSQWRGPKFNGSTDEKGLPENLDPNSAVWTIDLPGRGAATPIIHGDRVFMTSATSEKTLVGMCIDRKSGKILWQKQVGDGAQVKGNADNASQSPVTDGKTVFFYFGTGDLAAFDMDGKELWQRNIQKDHGKFRYQWIYGSTPLLHEGKLYIQVLQRDVPVERGVSEQSKADSYLLAVNPADGKDIWKVVRPTDAKMESRESYGTPMPMKVNNQWQIVLIGGDCVTGHDAETGKEIWRAGHWNPNFELWWRVVPSVVVAGDLVVACAPKGEAVMGIKPGEGNVTKSMAWETKDFTSDVCVPLYYNDKLYVLEGEKKQLTCVEPATGKKQWSAKLNSRPVFRASPTGADGKIYTQNENGEAFVLSAADGKTLSKVQLDNRDKAHAEVAVSQGQIFIRTGSKLYCFGKKD